MKVITHDRVFHADDVFATAILRIAFGDDVEVVRTRNTTVLNAEKGKPGVFLLDIGGRYDPTQRLFDHHQPEGAGFRDNELNEWPYATAGLVWKHYGKAAINALEPGLCNPDIEEIEKFVDGAIMKFIDAADCGIYLKSAGPTLSMLIHSFNSQDDESNFPLVLSLAQVILTNSIRHHVRKIQSREKVRQAPREVEGKVLVLDQGCNWADVVRNEMPEVLMVAYPLSTSEPAWHIRAVEQNSLRRISFPSAWYGRTGEDLAALCGIKDAVFCHRSGHLAGTSSLESALTMAHMAIQAQHAC